MEKTIENLNDSQLEAKLAEILGTWPLYREFSTPVLVFNTCQSGSSFSANNAARSRSGSRC
jgi:hypothetical protein